MPKKQLPRWPIEWLLDFVFLDLAGISNEKQAEIEEDVRLFPSWIRLYQAGNPYRAITVGRMGWTGIAQAQEKLRKAVSFLREGRKWGPVESRFSLESDDDPWRIHKIYSGTQSDVFLAAAADVLADSWHLTRACPHCDRLFAPKGKQRYCSADCRNRANWQRFQKQHPKRERNYRDEYVRRKAKQLGRKLVRTPKGLRVK